MKFLYALLIPLLPILLSANLTAESSSMKFPGWMPEAVSFPDWQNLSAASMGMPAFGKSRPDPDTGLKVWRLGGSPTEMHRQQPYPLGREQISVTHAQHFYSRTSPTNSDDTYALGSAGKSKPYAALWRLADKKLVAWVPGAQKEAHIQQRQLLWDRHEPAVYWYTEANRLIRASIDFNTYQVKTKVWQQFDDFAFVTFGFGEGNFSDDGNRLVLGGQFTGSQRMAFQPYELRQHRKLPLLHISDLPDNVDWASVDPTGKFIVFAQKQPEQTMVLPFEQAQRAKPRLLFADIKHSDFVVDKKGDSWLAYGDWRGLFSVRLHDGFHQRIWPVKTAFNQVKCTSESLDCKSAAGHVARVAGKPGMLLVSRLTDGGIYFMNVDAPGSAVYIGNSRHGTGPEEARNYRSALPWGVSKYGEVTSYLREARAAVSASGRYVFFTSDYRIHGKHKGSYEPEPVNRAFLNMIEVGG